MPSKIKSKLPANHGLSDRLGRADQCVIAVVLLEPHSVTHYENGDDPDYTWRIGHIEPLDGDAAVTAERLRISAYRDRTGEVELPLDGE